ncbi:MAG: hypothetical protein FOGNACKC_02978 [Anaerolineae bacterium]|nr:hypothetical protein [Anaerolineae bacterium]
MKKIFTVIILVAALQLLLVSASYAAPPAWGGGGAYHKVMYGETLYSIGRLYNVHPNCIAEANGLWNPNVIYAGEVLYVPSNCGSYPWYGHRPVNYPGQCWNDCYSGCGYDNCQPVRYPDNCWDNCGWSGKSHSYGYDYTGYYYSYGYQRYSHTCGYYNNCW